VVGADIRPSGSPMFTQGRGAAISAVRVSGSG